MCLTEDMEEIGSCIPVRAGIRLLQVAQCAAVASITFSLVTQEVTAIVMDGTHPNPNFFSIQFEKDTAFFNQEGTRTKNNFNYVQTITIIKPNNNPTLRKQVSDLQNCCCYIMVVTDNGGQRHLAGVSYDPITDTWTSEDLKTTSIVANTGADRAADSNEINITFTANVAELAPFLDSAVVLS